MELQRNLDWACMLVGMVVVIVPLASGCLGCLPLPLFASCCRCRRCPGVRCPALARCRWSRSGRSAPVTRCPETERSWVPIIINIPSLVHDVADCSLERSQVASSICQKFHLHSRIDGNTTLINSIFPQRWCTMIWLYLFNGWRHSKVAAFLTSSFDFTFYAEDKNLQVGEFFIHCEIQKSDIWICFFLAV